MSIDWFTVIAQIINFLILVFLLKRFLYQPILNAIDTREKRIAAQIEDAESTQAEAQKERREFEQKNEAFDQKRAELLHRAAEDAKAERQRLIGEAREAAEEIRAKKQELLKADLSRLESSIRLRTQQEVFAIARKALTDLGAGQLEDQTAEVFIRRLQELDEDAKKVLGDAITTSAEPIIVRSAFDLSEDKQAALHKAVDELFSPALELHFETVLTLIGGIELTVNGQKVAWSIADYLDSMEQRIGALIKETDSAQTNTADTAAAE